MNYTYLLQATPSGGGMGGFQFIFLGLMILVFWLFFIRFGYCRIVWNPAIMPGWLSFLRCELRQVKELYDIIDIN